jgi:hypothetical protein
MFEMSPFEICILPLKPEDKMNLNPFYYFFQAVEDFMKKILLTSQIIFLEKEI